MHWPLQLITTILSLLILMDCSSVPLPKGESPALSAEPSVGQVPKARFPHWLLYDQECDRQKELALQQQTESVGPCATKDKLVREALAKRRAHGATHALFLGPDSRCREQSKGQWACREALKCEIKSLLGLPSIPLIRSEILRAYPDVCRQDSESTDFLLFTGGDPPLLDPNSLREDTPIAVRRIAESDVSPIPPDPAWVYGID